MALYRRRRRRRASDEPDNHDRWLVSYADFITLLFAFFVVMYAISSISEGKYRVMSNSIVDAFRSVPGASSGVISVVSPSDPVPLAIPLIAGPSALATVMLMVSREPAKLGVWVAAMTAAMLVSAILLVLGEKIEKLLGKRAMEAVERLMGLILAAIAVEMLLGGIKQFLLQVK